LSEREVEVAAVREGVQLERELGLAAAAAAAPKQFRATTRRHPEILSLRRWLSPPHAVTAPAQAALELLVLPDRSEIFHTLRTIPL
jgi:hypothetical protein